MAIVPPSIFEENGKGYFKDNDVKKAKEYLEKGLEELGYKMFLNYHQLNFHTIQMKAHRKSLKPFKICGRRI